MSNQSLFVKATVDLAGIKQKFSALARKCLSATTATAFLMKKLEYNEDDEVDPLLSSQCTKFMEETR